jgi:hypothetical protein
MANAIGQRLDMTQAAKQREEKRRQELLARRGGPTGKAENITRGRVKRGKPGGVKTIMPVPKPVVKPGGTPGIKPGPAPRPIGRRGKPSPVPGIVSGGPKPKRMGIGGGNGKPFWY